MCFEHYKLHHKIYFKNVRKISMNKNKYHQKAGADIVRTISSIKY